MEGPLLDVGNHVVGVGEGQGRGEKGPGPAGDVPDLRHRLAQAEKAEQVLGEAPAHEHQHERRQHQYQQHEGGDDVDRLAAQEAAPAALQLEDHVERAARGLERSGGAVEREQGADHERRGGRALAQEGLAQRAVERIDERGGRHILEVVEDRVVGLGVLAEQAEQRESQQRGGKQRHQHVVGERRRMVGHLVVVKSEQSPLYRPHGGHLPARWRW